MNREGELAGKERRGKFVEIFLISIGGGSFLILLIGYFKSLSSKYLTNTNSPPLMQDYNHPRSSTPSPTKIVSSKNGCDWQPMGSLQSSMKPVPKKKSRILIIEGL